MPSESQLGSTAGGALTGAATGAAIGSVVPGIGTGIGAIGGALIGGIGGYLSGGDDEAQQIEAQRRQLLYQQAAAAGGFADQAQQGYANYGQQANGVLAALRRQASGQDSVSALQLRQALAQQYAQQRSFAAGASPRNAAAAARTAAIQMGNAGVQTANQQAIAGLQERQQANQAQGSLLSSLRGQDLSASLGSRQNAEVGYGANNAGAPPPSWIQQYGPAIVGGLGAYAQLNRGTGSGATTASDRRLKEDIHDGDDEANRAVEGLRAYVFKYKGKQYGEGKQLGVMAQDLERAGLKHAVIDTPAGKMVHGAKLATANTALLAALGRRVSKLEGKRK